MVSYYCHLASCQINKFELGALLNKMCIIAHGHLVNEAEKLIKQALSKQSEEGGPGTGSAVSIPRITTPGDKHIETYHSSLPILIPLFTSSCINHTQSGDAKNYAYLSML